MPCSPECMLTRLLSTTCVQGAVTLGIVAFLLAWIVQSFFANVLLNVVDAVFMCYALDRDTQVCVGPSCCCAGWCTGVSFCVWKKCSFCAFIGKGSLMLEGP